MVHCVNVYLVFLCAAVISSYLLVVSSFHDCVTKPVVFLLLSVAVFIIFARWATKSCRYL